MYASFALPQNEDAQKLYDFSLILFRHLKWLAQEMVKEGENISWNRENIPFSFATSEQMYAHLIDELLALELLYQKGALFDRIRSDERYMLFVLRKLMKKEPVELEAFQKRGYKQLDGKSEEALVLFLFEESYKEYELILTYSYSQLHTDSAKLSKIFDDLIYESLYHLKSFAILQGKLGVLCIPRGVMQEVYRFADMKKFLEDGIEEERAAKEQCKQLSDAIDDEELSLFFDFINNQEDFHIHLMQEAIELLK